MSVSLTCSSSKKKKLDRFIPHPVSRTVFTSDEKNKHNTNYQELLGQKLFSNKIVPKILQFGD